jgi:hypothetical protein
MQDLERQPASKAVIALSTCQRELGVQG